MDEAKIWERLGELTSEAKVSQTQRAELFSQVGDIKSDISEINVNLKEYTSTVAAMLDKHDGKIETFDTDISGLKKTRQRMYVAIAGLFGSGGISGAIMAKLGLG
tara:strand:- start:120 stop:434 length:315 start_codon:yes stop_codon:yes gene_type:complete